MTDHEIVERTARDFLQRQGPNVISVLIEHAEIDAERGDEPSAAAWRDIAEAAERLLRLGYPDEILPRGLTEARATVCGWLVHPVLPYPG